MPSAPSWQTWRQTWLPFIESILQGGNTCRPKRIKFSLPRRATSGIVHLRRNGTIQSPTSRISDVDNVSKEVLEREEELSKAGFTAYPRFAPQSQFSSVKSFRVKHEATCQDEVRKDLAVAGRISSIRLSGNKLAFIDVQEGDEILQAVLSFKDLEHTGISSLAFKEQIRLIRRGDHVMINGSPYRNPNGQLCIKANLLPQLQSPCLQRFPIEKRESEIDSHSDVQLLDRHVEMLTAKDVIHTIQTRSRIIKAMRNYFEDQDFVQVETPILVAAAGGATARAFETSATEFLDKKLALRIAPELWLKRLIVGGMTRVFEIGPAFRNEGLDKTHNPEFTTCEFYATYHTLPQLMDHTHQMFQSLLQVVPSPPPNWTSHNSVSNSSQDHSTSWQEFFHPPFSTIDFIPALNEALGTSLPNLTSQTIVEDITQIFHNKNLSLPPNPTLPRLLDKFCSTYLEPQCQKPTWIINTPECLSPLSKSFIHPTAPNNQPVAARAELFIKGKEVVNCYEEENDPREQKRKFLDQQRYAHGNPLKRDDRNVVVDDEAMRVDEDYIRALEWGLPPTGGWGCGIDRIVMLFTGKERIGDVLTFGNLRAVTRGAEKWEAKK